MQVSNREMNRNSPRALDVNGLKELVARAGNEPR